MAFVALSACSGEQRTASAAGPGGATGERAAAPVVVSAVEQRNIPVQLTAIGNVEAYSTISIKSRVTGALDKVYFKEGDSVKEGDPLFDIDPRPYEEAIHQIEANLLRDTALLRQHRDVPRLPSAIVPRAAT